MLSSYFYVWCFIFLVSYFYSEFFMFTLIHSSVKNLKFFSTQFTKSVNISLFKNTSLTYIIYFIIIFFFTLKINISNILFSFVIIYILINKYINKYFDNYSTFLNFNVIIFSSLFFFINNYVLFYLFIELYAIVFYFFFLNINFNFKQCLLIQYKNSLLLYLFNNFITSILYLIGLSYIIAYFGTINFSELSFFNYSSSMSWGVYFLIISFIFKLSLPGYHFLKIEIYKYLSLENVILFSVITLYINFLFTIFLFNQNLIFFALNSFKFLNLLLLCVFFFFLHKLKISNFQEFVSYSGFATNNLIILNFLI